MVRRYMNTRSLPRRHWMTVEGDGVILSGLDMSGYGTVIARDDPYIVVKWPRGSHWAGNYQSREYHPPTTIVYCMIDERDDMIIASPPNGEYAFRVRECVEWSNARRTRGD